MEELFKSTSSGEFLATIFLLSQIYQKNVGFLNICSSGPIGSKILDNFIQRISCYPANKMYSLEYDRGILQITECRTPNPLYSYNVRCLP